MYPHTYRGAKLWSVSDSRLCTAVAYLISLGIYVYNLASRRKATLKPGADNSGDNRVQFRVSAHWCVLSVPENGSPLPCCANCHGKIFSCLYSRCILAFTLLSHTACTTTLQVSVVAAVARSWCLKPFVSRCLLRLQFLASTSSRLSGRSPFF